jgi:hypothetical protein
MNQQKSFWWSETAITNNTIKEKRTELGNQISQMKKYIVSELQ